MVRLGRRAEGGSADDLKSGVLVIDKPVGPTSHDVVARLRKTFDTRAVGHAGTLDPAASGVLVVMFGQATKLAAYLTQQDKRYLAGISFGMSTTTLDSEGAVVSTAPIPEEIARELSSGSAGTRLEAGLEKERLRREQVPPAYSAIKRQGRAAHELARRGVDVALAPRPIEVKTLVIQATTADSITLSLTVSKGYYVRALARDLGESLGVPAHLSSLRRIASGPFSIEEALPLSSPETDLRLALAPLAVAAARALPTAQLSEEGARFAGHGKTLRPEHFSSAPPEGVAAWLGPEGELVAIGRTMADGSSVVERGFSHSTSSAAI